MSALIPAAVAHAERCPGIPVIEESSPGRWDAHCSMQQFLSNRCPGWEVSECESRAEAGAAFYGHDPRGN